MVVADGAYGKRPFLNRVIATGAVVVSRLREDAVLFGISVTTKRRGKGRPRKYGENPISLARRGGHRKVWTTTRLMLYGKEQNVTFKTFLATYAPVSGVIRVLIVKRSPDLFSDCPAEWVTFFCTDPDVSAATIIDSLADRSAIEKNFHDVKEVYGAGEQQGRNVCTMWRAGTCVCGFTRSWNCGRGNVQGTSLSRGMTVHGMILLADQVTRTA